MPETASILIVPSGQEEDHAIPRIRCVTVQNSLPELTRTPSPFESQEIHLHLHGAAPPPRAFMSIRGTDMEELSACRMTLHWMLYVMDADGKNPRRVTGTPLPSSSSEDSARRSVRTLPVDPGGLHPLGPFTSSLTYPPS
jgi:hypothetical protein